MMRRLSAKTNEFLEGGDQAAGLPMGLHQGTWESPSDPRLPLDKF